MDEEFAEDEVVADSPELEAGQPIGDLTLSKQIGSGGMGVV